MPALGYTIGNPGNVDLRIGGSDLINVHPVTGLMGFGEQADFVRGGHNGFERKTNAFFDQ